MWAVTRINLIALCSLAVAHLQASSHPSSSCPHLSFRSLFITLPGSPPLLNVTFYLSSFLFFSLEDAYSATDRKLHGNRKHVSAMFVIPQGPTDIGHCGHTRWWARQREEKVKGEERNGSQRQKRQMEGENTNTPIRRNPPGKGQEWKAEQGYVALFPHLQLLLLSSKWLLQLFSGTSA